MQWVYMQWVHTTQKKKTFSNHEAIPMTALSFFDSHKKVKPTNTYNF